MKGPRNTLSVLAAGAIIVLVSTAPAMAGLGDPTPSFPGGLRAKHVYSMTGVLSTPPGIITVVHCTSMEKTRDITVGVEFFDIFGNAENDIASGDGVIQVTPGATVSISSRLSTIYFEDANASIATNTILRSARVLATSTKLVCGANWIDSEDNPAVAARVPLYRKKQRGN